MDPGWDFLGEGLLEEIRHIFTHLIGVGEIRGMLVRLIFHKVRIF